MKQRDTETVLPRSVAPIFAAILLLTAAAFVSAQRFDRRATGPERTPANENIVRPYSFETGEELVYVAEFSRALLKRMDVADFRFTVSQEPSLQSVTEGRAGQDTGGTPYLLKLNGEISSKGFFSKLFNLRFRQQIESIVEPASFSVRKTKRVDEQGKRARVSETTYVDGKVLRTEHDPTRPAETKRVATAPFVGQVQDILSAIYYLRTRPLDLGKSFILTVSDSGRVYQVPVQVVEKKRKKTVLGRVETLRVDPQVFGRLIAGEGQFSIWFTNDNRRIPVAARIKNRYGAFDITLRKVN